MASSKNKIVLLIEDNPLLTGLYKAAFEKAGAEVYFAHDGETGLALVKEHKPAIVVLDILMPGLDGIGVLERLRKDPETKATKVVILTIVTEEKTQEKARELGVVDYLIKSELKLAEIVERVSKYFIE